MEKTATQRRIAIVGSGPVGIALATQLVKTGHLVAISNSRGPETLHEQAAKTGAVAKDIKEAVSESQCIILATPLSSITSIARTIEGALRPGTIIVDACNYYPSRDGQIQSIDQGEADSVWVARNFTVPLAKAFNNIIAARIVSAAKPRDSSPRSALPVSANSDEALAIAMALVDDVGFDAYNAGTLEDSWRYEPGQPAYCTEPSRQQLFSLLARASPQKDTASRNKTRKLVERLPEDFSPEILVRVSRLSAGLDTWNMYSWIAAVVFAFALLGTTIRSRK